MSLDKSIDHGKENRKPYFDSKAIDGSCRNHGSCPHCRGNRLHSNRKRELEAEEDKVMKEPEIEEHFTFPLPNGVSISSWAKAFTTRMKALADGYRVDGETENGEYIWEKCDRDVARDEAEHLCDEMFNLLSDFAASGLAYDNLINEYIKREKLHLFYKKALEITFNEKDRMEKEYYLDPDADYYEDNEDNEDEVDEDNEDEVDEEPDTNNKETTSVINTIDAMDERVKKFIAEKYKNLSQAVAVYIVWKCKILDHWKYLLSTNVSDGLYYEVTYDGNDNCWYVDTYAKKLNEMISAKDVR